LSKRWGARARFRGHFGKAASPKLLKGLGQCFEIAEIKRSKRVEKNRDLGVSRFFSES
jgi:hypothetical protein